MEPDGDPERQRRGACLSVLLTGGAASLFLVVVVLATDGWALGLLGIGAAVFLFGLIHYVLWGRLLLRETAGEREQEELRREDEARADEWPGPGSNGVRRLP